jgi:hypothetical protein
MLCHAGGFRQIEKAFRQKGILMPRPDIQLSLSPHGGEIRGLITQAAG